MAVDGVANVEVVVLDVDFTLDFVVANSNSVDCVQELLRRALIISGF
jgi:hypothetical protein